MSAPNIFSLRINPVTPLLFACLFLGFFSSQAHSDQTTDIGEFLEEIQRASDKVQSFSSSFIQERHLALFAKPVIFHGRLTVVRPDRLRWEFTSPVPSVLIFNGDRGLRCNDQAPAVQFALGADPVMRTVAEQLWLWLGGDYSRLSDLYRIEKKGTSSLLILPEDEAVSEYIGAVTITFNETSRQPEKVEIVEPGGDSTLIFFQSYRINGDTSQTLFSSCKVDE